MKKKIILIFSVCLFLFFNLVSVKAASIEKNEPNLDIEFKTDKKIYKKGDNIYYQIIVANNTEYDGKNFILNIHLPQSVTVENKREITFKRDEILSHKKIGFEITGKVLDNSGSVNIDINQNSSRDKVATADTTNVFEYIILSSVSGICLLLFIKNKKKFIFSIKILLVLSVSLTCFSIFRDNVYAKDVSYLNVSKNIVFKTCIENNEYTLTVNSKVDFYSKGNGKISLDQEVNQDNVYTCDSEKIILSGTFNDPDGVKEVKYIINDTQQVITSKKTIGDKKWRIEETLDEGYYYITIVGIDTLENESIYKFKVNVLNNKIILNDSTKILSEEQHTDGFVDSIFGKETITMIYKKSSYIAQKYYEGKLKSGTTLYFEPCASFLTGFSGTVVDIQEAKTITLPNDYIYPENIDYSDCLAIRFKEASIDKITKSNVNTYYNENTQIEPLFILTPDGGNLINTSDNLHQVKKANVVNKRGTNPISINCFDSKNIKIKFLDLKLYEYSKGEHKDEITLSGSVELTDLMLEGGFSKAKEKDVLGSLGITLNGKLKSSLKLSGNLEINTDNIVEKINTFLSQKSRKFENKTINGIGGIDYKNEIRLATIGIKMGSPVAIIGNSLDKVAYHSKTSPIVIISLTMGLDGKVQAKFSITREQEANTTASLYLRLNELDDFIKPKVSLNEITLPFGSLYKVCTLVSLNDKEFTPIKVEGEINSELEVSPFGYDVKLFFMGISPAHIGMQVKSKVQADFKGVLKRSAKKKWNADFEGSAKGKTGVYSIGEITLKFKDHNLIPDGLGINMKMNELVYLIDSFNLSTIVSKGSIYDSKTKEKLNLSNHRLALELDEDNVYQTDIKDGSFQFSKIPAGDYKVYLKEKDTNKVIYKEKVKITYLNPDFDLYIDYVTESPPEKESLIIKEGETIRFYGNDQNVIFYSANNEAIIDRALYDTRINYNGVNAQAYANESVSGNGWIPLWENEYMDITVVKGSLTIDKKTFESGITSELKNQEAIRKYELKSGESIHFEDKVGIGYITNRPIFINAKNGSAYINHYQGKVLGNKTFDIDLTSSRVDMSGYDNTVDITCTNGTIIVYVRSEEIDKVK